MTTEPLGKVVTFYSFKGGTGRTMALANVAWILAANGKRVLAVDWDLESPALNRYFSPFLDRDAIKRRRTVIGLIQDFQDHMARRDEIDLDEPDYARHADLADRVIPLRWAGFPAPGRLDLLAAGRLNRDYATVLAGLDWDDFYERHAGGHFLDALRARMKSDYDYVLIDSRTGYSDIADVCTVHMPDTLVVCFTLNEQSIEGSATVARQVEDHQRHVRILPVPMRIDAAEKDRSDAARAFAKERFEGLPEAPDRAAREAYWDQVFVPYQAYYNYEERLAAIGDTPGAQGTLLAAYELLTSRLTDGEVSALPRMDPDVRQRVNEMFERRLTVAERGIALWYARGDRIWAEWLTDVLNRAGIRVADPGADPEADTGGHRDLLIVSERSEVEGDPRLSSVSRLRPTALAVVVTGSARTAPPADRRATFLTGLGEQDAIQAVLRLVGHAGAVGPGAVRYPLDEPLASNLDPRNQRFTGRESELSEVRRQLLAGGSGPVSIVALQGMGGAGKSQIALEYAHRFRAAYDVVWWVKADPVTFVDTQLAELGLRLGLPLAGASIENARTVLDSLGRDPLHRRWLIIFDNAEDPERVRPLLPTGSGHVLVTSRSPGWGGSAAAVVPVDVFPRVESIELLRTRVPRIGPQEADQVAARLGDLPLAVAAAAAFLAETRFPVEEFLDAVRTRGLVPLTVPGDESAGGEPRDRPLPAVWDASLDELERRSPAAYRLLQFLSVLDASVALDFVYSDELNQELLPIDPELSERLLRGRLIRELSRLALARIESRADGVTVHRLIQESVRARMSEPELGEVRHRVHLALARFRPGGEIDDPQNWPAFAMIWPHLPESGAINCPDASVRQLFIERVRYLWLAGDFPRGLQQAEETEAAWQKQLEEMSRDDGDDRDQRALRRQLLHLRFHQAGLIRSLGHFAESRAVDEATLGEQRELLGDDHPHTLTTAGGLGGDLRGLGHYRQAVDLDRATHERWRNVFGEQHPRTLASLNNLATSWRLTGDYERALELDQQVLAGRRDVLGERHPGTLLSMTNIGIDLREAGEYQRSVAHLRHVAQALAEELAPEAWDTLNAQVNLAISLRAAGRVEEGRRLLDIVYGLLNEASPSVPALACRLSRAVSLLGFADEQALPELRAVHESYRSRLGPAHPHTLVCVNDLAMAVLATGTGQAGDSAHDLAGQAARQFAEALGADHPYTLAAETNLAVCLAGTGRDDAALTTLRSTVDRALTRLGPTHPDTLSCQANLAILLERTGAGGDPDTIGRRIGERCGTEHPAVAAVANRRLLPRLIDPLPF
ncbi:FxSxx-COOH system tetratricopeptide repeat protein [Actinoplanes sp. L3-i22]|uniref:FxSxx-COOH system tetratricopeptide repeat protein n=1 Tax=Actinoplanes sp. L3-i22 TaxID=2836373 RepID=UPI001C75C7FD|nr:FxSxx-COOH system tetratricopeptide repeat protein [Actinoplanes sp. L3-i22]BCY09377.1 hypothetical protein L3i22_044650 [Actinoplanes sp. L3-i22]